MNELKPCPFCGGKASRDSKNPYGDVSANARVFCLKCGCATPKIPISLDYSARDKADYLWNRRVEDAQMASEKEETSDDLQSVGLS